jgi:hypothetical protein
MARARLGRRLSLVATLVAALAATACSALLGVNDVFYDPAAPAAASGGPDGATVSGGDGGEAMQDGAPAADSAACGGVDLLGSEQNCGRCGHGCGGGKCAGGVCQPVLLAEAPRIAGLATDGQALYATSYAGAKVLRIEKTPGAGSVKTLRSDVTAAMGIAVSGNTLYVTAENLSDTNGGLHSCTLPACSGWTRITPLDFPRHLALAGANVFVATESGVVRTGLDGSAPVVIATYTQPCAGAADATHVYVVSAAPALYRVQHDGGAETMMGPRTAPDNYGFVTLGGDSALWAYVDGASKAGQVLSSRKDAPGTRVTFTSKGIAPVGVATDDAWVYWSDRGSVLGTGPGAVLANDGKLLACPRAGCPAAGPTVLISDLHGAGQIVLDDAFVYVAELGLGTDGLVRKVAKP